MNREFLRFYNQELAILREQAAEFAQDYPGIAERLGGLVGDAADPMISGLLEGAAFLAARVQLKLKHEFADFTTNLIDQLAPHYLAPTPSFVLVRAKPKFGDPTLRDGRTIAQGAVFDATYREAQRNVACRFTLAEADHALALRYRQGGVSDEFRSLPGSGAERPRELRRKPPASAYRAKRRGGGRRGRRQGSADPSGAQILVLPGEVAPLPSARPGDRRGRALRAAVRALHRRLFSRARRFRRPGHHPRAAPT